MSYKIVIHFPKNNPTVIETLTTRTQLRFVRHQRENKATVEVTHVSTDVLLSLVMSVRSQGGILSYKVKRLRSQDEIIADRRYEASAAKEYINE